LAKFSRQIALGKILVKFYISRDFNFAGANS